MGNDDAEREVGVSGGGGGGASAAAGVCVVPVTCCSSATAASVRGAHRFPAASPLGSISARGSYSVEE